MCRKNTSMICKYAWCVFRIVTVKVTSICNVSGIQHEFTVLKLYFYWCITIRFHKILPENLPNFGKFRNSGNSGKCRGIFSGKIPGNFPPDFPGFSGDETYVTALNLYFKKVKLKEISGNFGRKFSGNSGKFFPKTTRNFLRIFLRFFNWNVFLQP